MHSRCAGFSSHCPLCSRNRSESVRVSLLSLYGRASACTGFWPPPRPTIIPSYTAQIKWGPCELLLPVSIPCRAHPALCASVTQHPISTERSFAILLYQQPRRYQFQVWSELTFERAPQNAFQDPLWDSSGTSDGVDITVPIQGRHSSNCSTSTAAAVC